MKSSDFKYKTPAVCIIKGCLNPICWISEDEDIGLCDEHYKELEERRSDDEWDKINNIRYDESFKMLEKHPQLDLKVKLNETLYYSQFTVEGILEYIKDKTISLDVLKLILSKVPEYEKKIEGATIGSDKFILQELKERGYNVD